MVLGACGDSPTPVMHRTACGVQTADTARFAELQAWESSALAYLGTLYPDACGSLDGIRVDFVSAPITLEDGRTVEAVTYPKVRLVEIHTGSVDAESEYGFTHEAVHMLDWEVSRIQEPTHASWTERGIWAYLAKIRP